MAKLVVISDGRDFLTRNALEYLDSTYGIPADDIRAIDVYSEVGQIQTITVTLMVRAPASSPIPDPGEEFRH